jgi:hypothetical protein
MIGIDEITANENDFMPDPMSIRRMKRSLEPQSSTRTLVKSLVRRATTSMPAVSSRSSATTTTSPTAISASSWITMTLPAVISTSSPE